MIVWNAELSVLAAPNISHNRVVGIPIISECYIPIVPNLGLERGEESVDNLIAVDEGE